MIDTYQLCWRNCNDEKMRILTIDDRHDAATVYGIFCLGGIRCRGGV